MLVFSRKKNESIVINNDITIVVVEIRGDKVRLGTEAPRRRHQSGDRGVRGQCGMSVFRFRLVAAFLCPSGEELRGSRALDRPQDRSDERRVPRLDAGARRLCSSPSRAAGVCRRRPPGIGHRPYRGFGANVPARAPRRFDASVADHWGRQRYRARAILAPCNDMHTVRCCLTQSSS